MSATAGVNERLAQITAAGTSIWLDQIRRSLTEGGELGRMVAEESLRGVTANPSIFEKAILGSDDYDDELREMAAQDLSAQEIYDRIAIRDVQLAADVLKPVWEESNHVDGYVSLEVAPNLAHETDGTTEAARHYWQQLSRKNTMIKIPGTPAGVGAIEQAIYEGINVNVTLLFSVESYEAVAEAYLRGLERRQADGLALDVHSVASFFVSRVDTNIDRKLEELGRSELAGRAALANARNAYRRFREIFSGPRWEGLRHAGASVQRPLWASTGVKNPDYPDTMYVDGLVGRDTVNTMPMATLHAAADHAHISGPTAEQDASEDLEALREAGIDLAAVTEELLVDGLAQFESAMGRLLAGIDRQRAAIATGRPAPISGALPPALEEPVRARVQSAVHERVAERVWRRDESLWGGPGVPEIGNRLGWLTVADAMLEHAADLTSFAAGLHAEGYTDAVLLGMGGSSLGPEVIRRSFGDQQPGLKLQVLDSTHPDAVLAVQDSIDVARTIFVVSSKSGGTVETLSHYRHFAQLAKPEQFVVVTDPGSPLEELARTDGLRRVFRNPPDIGGRYSVLSYFGLVPAALAGVDIEELLHGSQVAEAACAHHEGSESNSGLWLGASIGELARQGRDKLTFLVGGDIESFGLWVEQLVAESTGKHGRGILPVAEEPLGEAAEYGADRVFALLRDPEHPTEAYETAAKALEEAGHPVFELPVHGAADLGRIFFLAEFAVAVAGWALEINPFDQPNVQEAKDNTKRVLESGQIPELADADDGALRALLGDANPPHYVAIMGYVPFSAEFDRAVAELRRRIRAATGAATTFGYGPRFLHSTGQLHKGGPPVGRFLQLTSRPQRDAEIPGEDYTFGKLIAAQAAGDLQTLRDHGLPAERVDLGEDPVAGLERLTARIHELLKEN